MRSLHVGWVLVLLVVSRGMVRAEDPEPWVNTELVALSVYDAVEELFYLNDGKLATFRSGGVGLGQPMPYKGPARLRLYRSRDDVEAPLSGPVMDEQAPHPEPVAEVDLPQGVKRVLLLCFLRNAEPMTIRAIPASFDQMDTGSYQIFNFASIEARFLLGEKWVRVPPLSIGTLSDSAWKHERQGLKVQVGAEVGGEFRMVYSSVWGHDPQRRYFVFVFDGTHASMPLQIRKVHDRRPPPSLPEE